MAYSLLFPLQGLFALTGRIRLFLPRRHQFPQLSILARGTGRTTAQLKNITTFAETEAEGLDAPWDIVAVAPGHKDDAYTWSIVQGQSYPFLNWEGTKFAANPVRALPDVVMRGQEFEVTVTFTSFDSDFRAVKLLDVAPANWAVATNLTWNHPAADLENALAPNEAAYAWSGPYADGTKFTAVYRVQVPPDAPPATYSFPGGTLEYCLAGARLYARGVGGNYQVEVTEMAALVTGETRDVSGDILAGVTVKLLHESMMVGSALSDEHGVYTLTIAELGEYGLVASKDGFRPEQHGVLVDESGAYTLGFVGDRGLIPNAPNVSYVLRCVNRWQFGSPPSQLEMSRVLAVINAWQFPV